MIFEACLIISFIIFLCGVVGSPVILKKIRLKKQNIEIFELFAVTVFLSAFVLFIPIYTSILQNDSMKFLKVILLSIHNTIRLFIVDGEFNIISDNLIDLNQITQVGYSTFSAILFVIAPILTFSAVLSLLVNTFSYKKFILNYNKELYVFSELNNKSLTLAKSLYSNDEKVLIIFNDVFEHNDENSYEIINEAKKINAICFKKDITAINYHKHSKKSNINFVIIGEDDNENIEQTIWLFNNYSNREKTNIYLFSSSVESEYVVSSLDSDFVKIRRINETQSLVYTTLYETGEQLFDNAKDNGDVKTISAAVIGIGSYGTEMIRALSWLCQMDGYFLEMNCIDKDKSAVSRLRSLCSGLFENKYNKYEITDQDCRFTINADYQADALSYDFDNIIDSLKNTTYVFVALGSDELNIQVSAKLRRIFEKNGIHPVIQAVVYNSHKKYIMEKAKNFNGQALDICFVGDEISTYSRDVIFKYEVEKLALARHLNWGSEESFWKYEYNYRSSVASVIHRKMKLHCKIPGADKPLGKRTISQRDALRKLEHRRWNAYMLSEGYTYADVRNDLAKQHHLIIPFDELDDDNKAKDDD